MIVICLSDCPPKLRGDITKWLAEINTGVYVGNLSARVREELWERICKNLKDGRATMVYSAPGEQKMAFRVYHSPWEPVDLDGITLMRRPISNAPSMERLPKHFSKAAHRQMQRKRTVSGRESEVYFAAAIAAAGKPSAVGNISEIAAVRVENGTIAEQVVFRIGTEENAVSLAEAMSEFLQFVGTGKLILHDAAKAIPHVRAACQSCGLPMSQNEIADTLLLARRRLTDIRDFGLSTIAEHLQLELPETRNAVSDCRLTVFVYEKLKNK